MSLLERFLAPITRREDAPRDGFADKWFSPFISTSGSGVYVNGESAIANVEVYAAIAAISQTIACFPLITYENGKDGGRERATTSSFYNLLGVAVSETLSSGEWVEITLVHLCLRGNAFTYKLRDRSGRVVRLIPFDPRQMVVSQLDDYSIVYTYTFKNGEKAELSERDIMHFRFGMSDGLVGRSPITIARECIGLTIATERYATKFFTNGAKPSGVISHPSKLDKDTSDRIRDSWQKSQGGEANMHKVAVLEEGMTFTPMTINSRDAQFLEQRKFQLEEIARLFRVPPHILGDLSRATFSNIEQQNLNFLTYSLMPYLRRFEQTLKLNFFMDLVNGKELYAEFLVDAILRGDTLTRNQSLEIRRRNGVLTANEWRKLENMVPIKDEIDSGNKYLVPLNMTWSDKIGEEPPPPTSAGSVESNPTPPKAEDKAASSRSAASWTKSRSYARNLFSDILDRMLYKERKSLETLEKRTNDPMKADEFFTQHREIVESALHSAIELYASQVSTLSGKVAADSLTESVRSAFWERYYSSRYCKLEERSFSLSEDLCDIIEWQYGVHISTVGDKNGTNGKKETPASTDIVTA